MAKAAGLLMLTTLIARILGLLRDIIIYSWFGTSYATDAYVAAFSIPDLIYLLLVGGALSSAFIPVFSGYLARKQEDDAWKAASIVLNYTLLVLLILIVIAEIYTRPLVALLVPDLPAGAIELTVSLTRIMFIQTFFMVLNGIAMGVLNSKEHFYSPALGSILYNIGIIGLGVALHRHLGITAFAIGVVGGSILNLIVQIPSLIRTKARYCFSFDLSHPGFRSIIKLMMPVAIGLSVSQLNLFVTQNLASGLSGGSISALNIAQRIMQVPIGIFGISIAVAVFPNMNFQAARGEIDELKRTFSLGLRAIFLITIPAGAGLIALREPLIQLFFQQGSFSGANTSLVAGDLLYYSFGIFAYSALQLQNRIFYSLKDTITPVLSGIMAVALNLAFSLLLIRIMGDTGLALAYSLAGIVNIFILTLVLKHRLGSIDGLKIARSVLISTVASAVMFIAVRLLAGYLEALLELSFKLKESIVVASGIAVGVFLFTAIVLLFRLEESQLVLGIIKNRIPGLKYRF